MFNICLIIEYDGRSFHGWQKQPGQRTIQGELERVLAIVLRRPSISLTASGRTDTGVHARAQVVNFKINELPDLNRLKAAVSHLLRHEVAVLEAFQVPSDFHATRSAVRKQYSYRIIQRAAPLVLDQGRAWHVVRPLDTAAMAAAAREIIGTKDFASFECAVRPRKSSPINRKSVQSLDVLSGRGSTVRTIFESVIETHGQELIYRIVGSGFLKQMVRTIVGTLVAIGKGRGYEMSRVIAARDRMAAAETAPAYGLYLDWVEYPPEYWPPKNLPAEQALHQR